MTAAAKQLEAGPEKDPPYKPMTRLSVAYFRAPVNFGGEERDSLSVPSKADLERGQRASNAVDSIELAYLDSDGTIYAAEAGRSADGLVAKKKRHNLNNGRRQVEQTFIPWANVRSISYGE